MFLISNFMGGGWGGRGKRRANGWPGYGHALMGFGGRGWKKIDIRKKKVPSKSDSPPISSMYTCMHSVYVHPPCCSGPGSSLCVDSTSRKEVSNRNPPPPLIHTAFKCMNTHMLSVSNAIEGKEAGLKLDLWGKLLMQWFTNKNTFHHASDERCVFLGWLKIDEYTLDSCKQGRFR